MNNHAIDYEGFYKGTYTPALYYAVGILNNMEDAADVVGDAFLKLMEMEDRIDTDRNPKSLFFSIVHNKCLDCIRRRKCVHGAHARIADSADRYSDNEFDSLCQREMFSIIGRMVDQMKPLHQQLFRMVRIEGYSYKEMAEVCGLSVRSVEYHTAVATQKVRKRLLKMCV